MIVVGVNLVNAINFGAWFFNNRLAPRFGEEFEDSPQYGFVITPDLVRIGLPQSIGWTALADGEKLIDMTIKSSVEENLLNIQKRYHFAVSDYKNVKIK
jgi:hypothetical protein